MFCLENKSVCKGGFVIVMITEIFLWIFWRDNWRSLIGLGENFCFSVWFSTRLSSQTKALEFFPANSLANYCFFAQQFSNLGFKAQDFNFQFLTQTNISFSRSMVIFWFTLISSLTDHIVLLSKHWQKYEVKYIFL